MADPKKTAHIQTAPSLEMISVIIHEVGHNYFPMIVNLRRATEGNGWTKARIHLCNTTEQGEFGANFPEAIFRIPLENLSFDKAGEPFWDHPYMSASIKVIISPAASNPENGIPTRAPTAYAKPATALKYIKRDHSYGGRTFDHALKTYAQRWMFKHLTRKISSELMGRCPAASGF